MSRLQLARLSDQVARIIFLICAIFLIVVIVGVFLFIGSSALRFAQQSGVSIQYFLTNTNWQPISDPENFTYATYGAGGLLLGSVVMTLLSVIIVTPLAFGMALFMTEISPRWLEGLLRPLLEIFTGMPSVVIGFLGLTILVPFITKIVAPYNHNLQTSGFGWGAGTIVLVIMILPTVISISIDALRAVPGSVREASLALGSTRWQMMSRAIIPAAAPGLATAVVLGMARAIGETLAVSMVLQGSTLPNNFFTPLVFFQPNLNVTSAIVQNFQDSAGTERDAFWMLAFVLLLISLLFISISRYLASRSTYK